MTVKVALVDDYEVVVRGLATMLRNYRHQVEVVELDANTSVEARTDIALYDSFAAPRGDRAEILRLVENPAVDKVAVYTWNFEQGMARAALAAGASGYLSKGLSARLLVRALLAIHAGDRVISPTPRARGVAGGDWPGREEGLTEREAEVLALITQGLNNEEISRRMRLSPNTVKSYIRTCYRRIGVTDRANALLWGVAHGFRPDYLQEPGRWQVARPHGSTGADPDAGRS